MVSRSRTKFNLRNDRKNRARQWIVLTDQDPAIAVPGRIEDYPLLPSQQADRRPIHLIAAFLDFGEAGVIAAFVDAPDLDAPAVLQLDIDRSDLLAFALNGGIADIEIQRFQLGAIRKANDDLACRVVECDTAARHDGRWKDIAIAQDADRLTFQMR